MGLTWIPLQACLVPACITLALGVTPNISNVAYAHSSAQKCEVVDTSQLVHRSNSSGTDAQPCEKSWNSGNISRAVLTGEPVSSPGPHPPTLTKKPLAGRQAAEGRARPGRSLSPMEVADSEAAADEMPPEPDPAKVPAFTPPPEAFPSPGRRPGSGRRWTHLL